MTTERVMLLIDADNVSVDVMEQAVRLLMNQHGAVHVRRAYCTAESAVKHQAVFKRLSIKPMVNLSAGKNSTDIALAVDAVDLVLAERPDVVVIASSDSDFAPLVARLREKGCVVRGIGQEGKTGDETQDAYDDFTVLAHRKAAGAGSAAAGVPASAQRGGGRSPAGGRTAASPPKPQKPQATQKAHRPQKAQGPKPAQGRPTSASDQAEDEAAAGATLAALRLATERAASQQAAAQAEAAAAAAAADSAGAALVPASADLPAPAAKKSARKSAAPKAARPQDEASAKPARKTAARKALPKTLAAAPVHQADVEVAALAVADAEALAAQIAVALAPPAAPSRAAPAPASAAVAALPDKVLEILASLPELARGDTVELRLASQRLRDAGLLGKSAPSTKLLGQFPERFELLPPGQPNHVRLRGGRLV